MQNSAELREVVYNILLMRIQFGICSYGEKLPNIEETSARLCVSVDTARAAYLKLKEEGYISLTKNVGATVKANYDKQETEQFIQDFFAMRKNAMIDLAKSMLPLFSNVQWVGLKYASSETLQRMEQLSCEESSTASYAMLKHINCKYSPLGNSLLMRLVWQVFMFLHNPFFSIKENLQYLDQYADYLPEILIICRNKNWSALRNAIDQSIERISLAITRLYEAKKTKSSLDKKIPFYWSSYKKSQQLCYSFAMELLISINRGIYPVGSMLPSQKELAKEKGISLSTLRRAFELLESVGAIKSTKYVGTQVLPFDKATDNSDFTNPVLRRRLIDMIESLQVLALSCREVSLLTLSSLDSHAIEKLCQVLKENQKLHYGDTLTYFILKFMAKSAPYQAIRTVYSELLQQLFWAYALRGMKENQETFHAVYSSYYDEFISSLEKADFPRFSAKLEELALYDFRETVHSLSKLGISEVESILVPDESVLLMS